MEGGHVRNMTLQWRVSTGRPVFVLFKERKAKRRTRFQIPREPDNLKVGIQALSQGVLISLYFLQYKHHT